ncbi:hypothetical protein VIGAN_UM086900, partial [Vigna angularis var. angularis]
FYYLIVSPNIFLFFICLCWSSQMTKQPWESSHHLLLNRCNSNCLQQTRSSSLLTHPPQYSKFSYFFFFS